MSKRKLKIHKSFVGENSQQLGYSISRDQKFGLSDDFKWFIGILIIIIPAVFHYGGKCKEIEILKLQIKSLDEQIESLKNKSEIGLDHIDNQSPDPQKSDNIKPNRYESIIMYIFYPYADYLLFSKDFIIDSAGMNRALMSKIKYARASVTDR